LPSTINYQQSTIFPEQRTTNNEQRLSPINHKLFYYLWESLKI